MSGEFKKSKGRPLYIQLYEAVSEDIISGRLPNGAKLPARRAMAEKTGMSQNTVDSAYKMLLDTGYIVSVPRQGYIVSFRACSDTDTPWEINAPEKVVFSPNGIDTSRINRAAYAKIIKDIAYNDGTDIFSYVDKGGEFELRSAVSKYLYSFRGVKCSPDEIIIGAGAEYLLASLAVLFPPETSFVMENPCDAHFYRVLAAYRNRVVTLPVNIGDFDIDALYRSGGEVLFTEPDARFPRSAAMSAEDRRALLEWADDAQGRFIIENCCDSEIQWEQNKTLRSMDKSGRVIYLGSFARSFCPAVKTAYMVLPPELMERWKNAHAYYYALTSKAEQFALAEFINKGYFTKHYKAMRRLYKEKRAYLRDCLSEVFGERISICGTSGSTYVSAYLSGADTDEIKRRARRAGVKLLSMNSFNINRNTEPVKDDRLVIGFGDLTRESINMGVRLWGGSIAAKA